MMEIAFGHIVLGCTAKSVVFGLLFALLDPMLEARLAQGHGAGLVRRAGLCLVAGGLFGIADLAIVAAADGYPPRIIQTTAAALLSLACLGALLLLRDVPRGIRGHAR